MRISITVDAQAAITESWTLDVPDDLDIEVFRTEWSDYLDHPEEYGIEIYEVRNIDVRDETERELHAIYNWDGEEL